jgi:hypothetical protein
MKQKAKIWQTYIEGNPNQREKSEIQYFCPGVQNGGWKMQCLTYMGERINVITFKYKSLLGGLR